MIAINNETQRAVVYESYTSDALRLLLQSVTNAFGGSVPKYRYAELIGLVDSDIEENPEEKAEQIIDKFLADLGGGKK